MTHSRTTKYFVAATKVATFAVLPCLLMIAVSTIAAPRVMNAVDMVELTRLSAPALSSDGKFLAYKRSQVIWSKNKEVKRLRLLNLDTGESINPIEPEDPGESFDSVVWIAPQQGFITTLERKGDKHGQAYFYDMETKALRRLTEHATDVGNLAWSPDNTGFYFTAKRAKPTKLAKDYKNRWLIEEYESKPYNELWFHEWSSGETRYLLGGDFNVRSYAVARDASKIIYARTDHSVNDRADSELWLFDVAGGTSTRVTNNTFAEGNAELSPDNRKLVYIATVNSEGESYYEDNVFVKTLGEVGETLILPKVPMELLDVAWSRNGNGLYLLGNSGVRSQLYHYELRSGALTALTKGDSEVSNWVYSPNLEQQLFIKRTAMNPGEIWSLSTTSNASKALTDEYKDFHHQFKLPEQRLFTWRGRRGVTIEGLLVMPIDYSAGKTYPLVTITHGGPRSSSQYGSWNYSRYVSVLAGQGYMVFLPNHRGSSGYGDKFLRDMVGKYFRHAHLDVLDGIDALIKEGYADANQLVKMGWSAGGHMTNKLITVTDRFRAASSGAGASDWVSMYGESDVRHNRGTWFGGSPWQKNAPLSSFTKQSMIKDTWRVSTPTLFFVGGKDVRVPPTQSIMMYRGTKAAGVETRLFVAPGQSHSYSLPSYRLFKINTELQWYARHLGRSAYEPQFPAAKSESD